MEPASIQDLIRRSNAGDPVAITEVSRPLLAGRDAPKAPEKGAALILAAAEKDWPDALAMSAPLLMAGIVAPVNWSAAVDQLRKAAALGHGLAKAQLDLLAAEGPGPDTAFEPISTSPRVWWMRRVITPAECRWLMDRARGRLELATVYDPELGGLNANQVRTNTLFEFNLAEADLIVMRLRARLSEAFGVAVTQMEASNILHYEPGQRFGRHFDFLQPSKPALAEEIARQGQRIGTAITYLNDAYEGGETEFPALKTAFRGAVGDALCFLNVDQSGRPDINTLHAGLAPTSGEKWVFSQFLRDKPQP